MNERTITIKEKAKKIARSLKKENPDYYYLKELFKNIRNELNIKVEKQPKHLPYVPTEEEIKRYYKVVFESENMQNVLIIKILLYTGVRVGELVNIKIEDVDLVNSHIRINNGKGNKDRVVPFPEAFKEVLALHIESNKKKKAAYLFESSWKKGYSVRGIRKIVTRYSKLAGMSRSLSPHKLRHFLFTWIKKQGIDDALIQPYSGHQTRQSLEVYSKLSITEAQKEYEKVIKHFPV
jgi:integrase/recombinase XerD